MNIETIQLTNINPAEYNPRIITKDEFEGLKTSLQTFGQQENLIVNKDMTLISGHQRLQAMLALGWTDAVCNVVDLDKHEEKKLNVLMNSQAISGQWDDLKLAEILEELKLDDNYESLRLNALEPLDLSPTEVEEDESPEVSSEPPVSKLGEIYQLGRHRVMCGDSTDLEQVRLLTGSKKLDVSFTSPPYNVGHNLGYSKKKSKYNSSDDNIENYLGLLVDTTRHSITFAEESFVNLQFLANNKKDLVLYMAEMADWFKDIFFWKKRQVQPAAAMNVANSQAEVIFYLSENNESDDKEWVDMVGLYGMNNTRRWGNKKFRGTFSNVIETKSASGENKNADIHNATMPVALPSAFFQKGYNAGSTILDLFGGTGTTLIACEQLGMKAYLMELDPKYVDVIRKRYWKFVNGTEEGWEDGTTNSND